MTTPAPTPAPSTWPADAREHYEERAAILEYDGGYPRREAERRARLIVEARLGISPQTALALPGDARATARERY